MAEGTIEVYRSGDGLLHLPGHTSDYGIPYTACSLIADDMAHEERPTSHAGFWCVGCTTAVALRVAVDNPETQEEPMDEKGNLARMTETAAAMRPYDGSTPYMPQDRGEDVGEVRAEIIALGENANELEQALSRLEGHLRPLCSDESLDHPEDPVEHLPMPMSPVGRDLFMLTRRLNQFRNRISALTKEVRL